VDRRTLPCVPNAHPEPTAEAAYAERLQRLSHRGGRLRRLIDPQRPYRWNLRRMNPGFVLDIGCGIGRNLRHLDGNGIGVDHNAECVAACRAEGLTAYVTADFPGSPDAVAGRFDSLLFAHVLEHMSAAESDALLETYLPYLRPGGKVIVITPQERGQASDETHVMLVDESVLRAQAERLQLTPISVTSFPFPRPIGKVFTYNETVAVLEPSGGGR
jgi:2-polyprenyl-3-methyl-5-hydroxy-6-metoxy-1,4-benzoquinol methylase